MKELLSKREQAELRKAAIEYVRCWKVPVSAEAGVALKNLHTAARAFAEKTDTEWAAEVAELKDALRMYGGHVPSCAGRPCSCGFQGAWQLLEDE